MRRLTALSAVARWHKHIPAHYLLPVAAAATQYTPHALRRGYTTHHYLYHLLACCYCPLPTTATCARCAAGQFTGCCRRHRCLIFLPCLVYGSWLAGLRAMDVPPQHTCSTRRYIGDRYRHLGGFTPVSERLAAWRLWFAFWHPRCKRSIARYLPFWLPFNRSRCCEHAWPSRATVLAG